MARHLSLRSGLQSCLTKPSPPPATPLRIFFFEPTTQNLHEGRPEQGLRKKSHISPGRSKPSFFLSLLMCSRPPPLLKFDFRVSFRVSRAKPQKKKKDTGFPQGRGVSTASDPRANSTGLGFCLQGREDDKKDVEMGCCYSVPDAPDVILPGALISQNRPGVRIRVASSQIDRG